MVKKAKINNQQKMQIKPNRQKELGGQKQSKNPQYFLLEGQVKIKNASIIDENDRDINNKRMVNKETINNKIEKANKVKKMRRFSKL